MTEMNRESGHHTAPEPTATAMRVRILVVDDSDASREHFLAILHQLPGVETLSAHNGLEALRQIRAGNVSLVLCDYEMPDLSGLQVLHAIRQIHAAVELPVLMLTSHDDSDVKVKAFRAGANDYIAKHSQPEELLARVGTQIDLLRSHRRLAAERMRKTEHEKFAAVGRLADGLAHELNTPAQYMANNLAFMSDGVEALGGVINRIRNELSGLARERVETLLGEIDHGYLTTELPRAIAESRVGIDHVASIVAVMREFSRPSADERGVYDLNEIVRSAVAVTRGQWAPLAELELELSEPLPNVECVGAAIKQLVLKAIMDAVHAMSAPELLGQRGRLTLRTRCAADDAGAGQAGQRWVVLEIADTGAPISQAFVERVLNPVLSLPVAAEQALAHARSVIVEEHAGRLYVQSSADAGTRLILQLPVPIERELQVAASQRRTW